MLSDLNSKDLVELAKLAGYFVAGIGAVWGVWKKIWVERVKKFFDRKRMTANINRESIKFNRMTVALDQWKFQHHPLRALCFVASNSGSHWDAHKSIYVSVVTESSGLESPRIFERWQKWVADPPYRQLLNAVNAAGSRGKLIITKDMMEGELKDHYKEQGVVAAVFFKILMSDSAELFYVGIEFGEVRHKDDTNPGSNKLLPLSDTAVKTHLDAANDLYLHPERIRDMARLGENIWTSKV